MAKTLEELFPHKFSVGDTVKVVARDESEWCKVGNTHKIRICKHDHEDGAVYVVDDDNESAYIRECNLELSKAKKQKDGEWKRHRGNKLPIDGGLYIEAKLRCGDIQRGYAQDFIWPNAACDVEVNLMKYRVIGQTQAEEVEMKLNERAQAELDKPDSEKGIIQHESSAAFFEHLGIAKTDQVDGPIKWRDTVNELDAYIEEFTRERESLINRLALEGFALIPAMTAVMGVADVDMGDWRNWKVGDKIRMTARDWCDLTKGAAYEIVDTSDDYITIIDDVDYRRSLEVDDETMFEHGRLMDFEFVSSP